LWAELQEAKYEPWNYEATEIRATDKNNSDYASCMKLSKAGNVPWVTVSRPTLPE